MTFDTAAKTMMGVSPAEFAIQSAGFGAGFVGANCGIGPAELLHSVREMLPATDVPVIAKGNCGIPAYVDGGIHYHGTPELMGDYACFARDAGIKIIGGCCGTTPEHVAAMAAALARTPSRPFDEVVAEAALGGPDDGMSARSRTIILDRLSSLASGPGATSPFAPPSRPFRGRRREQWCNSMTM